MALKELLKDIKKRYKEEERELETYEVKEIFSEYMEGIDASKKETITILLEEEVSTIKASKIGGNPYFPTNKDYPLDEDGKPMALLCQINFDEVPQIKDFPTSGYLQFFLRADDDVMGLDFEEPTNQANFRVMYHENIKECITDFSFLEKALDEVEKKSEFYMPFERGYEKKISFEKTVESASLDCYELTEILGKDLFDYVEELLEKSHEEELSEDYVTDILYCCVSSGSGHKLSGYPYFAQEDPRGDGIYDTLLFQLDSDDEFMWGDCGVANFFIKSKDLKDKKFDCVLYNWDCG